MMYLLDFYHTLFDGDAFERERASGPYAPGELSRFLYADAASFLREKENSVLIVTSMTKEADGGLIQSALHGIPRMSVMYTGGTLKGEYLAPFIGMYGSSPVFVDDSPDHLASLSARCPDVQLFEMRRDGKEGDGRWPVIRTLSELP